jgi:hypothetical protein
LKRPTAVTAHLADKDTRRIFRGATLFARFSIVTLDSLRQRRRRRKAFSPQCLRVCATILFHNPLSADRAPVAKIL